MRILWVSNAAWAPQGYGVQGRGLLPHLIGQGHEIAVFAFYGLEGGKVDLPLNGVDGPVLTHYPRLLDPYGNDAIALHAADWQADVVITLMDAWVLDPREIKFPWLAWLPIDHDPIPEQVLGRLPFMKRALPYSKFGRDLVSKTGVPCSYIPHGVDTHTFVPFGEPGRRGAKTALGFEPDDFVVGMVGANKGFPSRKGFPEAFQAFAKLRESVPSARLYVHSHASSAYGGPDLHRLAELCGIASYTRFGDQYQMAIGGIGAREMAITYNAMDVLLQPSTNEGFGIPLVEAQACGVPVIATDNTSMSELVAPGGWSVPVRQKQLSSQMSWVGVPNVDGLVEALLQAHHHATTDGGMYQESPREFAEAFDWKLVADHYWRPMLEQVAEELGVPRAEPTERSLFERLIGDDEDLPLEGGLVNFRHYADLEPHHQAATEETMQRAAEIAGVKLGGDLGEVRSPHNPDGELVKTVLPASYGDNGHEHE